MADIDTLVPTTSKFLTKEDVGELGKNLTIKTFSQAEVKGDSGTEVKAVIEWQEQEYKPMVLNKENATRLKAIFKTSNTDEMIGGMVNVYNDQFVTFAGRQTGGVRLRPPQHAQHAQQQAQQQPQQRPATHQDSGWQPTPPPEAYENEPY